MKSALRRNPSDASQISSSTLEQGTPRPTPPQGLPERACPGAGGPGAASAPSPSSRTRTGRAACTASSPLDAKTLVTALSPAARASAASPALVRWQLLQPALVRANRQIYWCPASAACLMAQISCSAVRPVRSWWQSRSMPSAEARARAQAQQSSSRLLIVQRRGGPECSSPTFTSMPSAWRRACTQTADPQNAAGVSVVVGLVHRDAGSAKEALHPHGVALARSSHECRAAVAVPLVGVDAVCGEQNLHAGGVV